MFQRSTLLRKNVRRVNVRNYFLTLKALQSFKHWSEMFLHSFLLQRLLKLFGKQLFSTHFTLLKNMDVGIEDLAINFKVVPIRLLPYSFLLTHYLLYNFCKCFVPHLIQLWKKDFLTFLNVQILLPFHFPTTWDKKFNCLCLYAWRVMKTQYVFVISFLSL